LRSAADPELQAGALARQRREKIADADASFNRAVAPHEMSCRGEALGDRGPCQRNFGIGEGFGDVVDGIARDNGSTIDADLRERDRLIAALGIRLGRARKRVEQDRPIRISVGRQVNRDPRAHERDIGDLDASNQQRQEAQVRGQTLRR
jgi:hypothetical protein